MPLVDKYKNVTPGLSEIGRIRLGEWAGDHPVSLGYLRLDDAPELVALYGERPTELYCMPPFEQPDRICDAYYELWGGGQRKGRERGDGILKCRGDGARSPVDGQGIHKALDKQMKRQVQFGHALAPFNDGDYTFQIGDFVPCSGEGEDLYPKCKDCAATIRLKLVVRDPNDPTGRTIANNHIGYYTISTGSDFNYRRVMEKLLWVGQQIDKANASYQSAGISFRLSMIMVPLILRRTQVPRNYVAEDGTEKRRLMNQLALDVDPVWSDWLRRMQPSVFDMPERELPLLDAQVPSSELFEDAQEGMDMGEFGTPDVVEGKLVNIPPIPEKYPQDWWDYFNHKDRKWFRSIPEFEKFCAEHLGVDNFKDHPEQWNAVWESLPHGGG